MQRTRTSPPAARGTTATVVEEPVKRPYPRAYTSNVHAYTFNGEFANISNTVSASFFEGDGSQLSNVTATSLAEDISVANLTVTNSLVAETATVNTDLVATGNVEAAFFVGDGSLLTNVPPTTNASLLTEGVLARPVDTTGEVKAATFAGVDATLAGTVTAAFLEGDGGLLSNVTADSLADDISVANLTVTNSLVAETATINTDLVAAGNVEAAFFVGDGSLLTNVPPTTNASLLTEGTLSRPVDTTGEVKAATFAGVDATLAGTVTAAFLEGDGGLLSNLTADSLADDISVANLTVTNSLVAETASINTDLVAAGNVEAAFFVGDGSLLTNVPPTTNASLLTEGVLSRPVDTTGEVKAATFAGVDATLAGTVTAAFLEGDGGLLSNVTADSLADDISVANLTVTNSLVAETATVNTDLVAAGNVEAAFFVGDGSLLTNVPPTTNASLLTEGVLSRPVDTTGEVKAATFAGVDATLAGTVTAAFLEGDGGLLSNVTADSLADDISVANLTVTNSLVAETATVNTDLVATGNVEAAFIIGDGSLLVNVPPTTDASLLTEGVLARPVDTTGEVKAATFSGVSATLAGTVTAAFLEGDGYLISNVTADSLADDISVANLTVTNSLVAETATVNTDLIASGNVEAAFFVGDGSLLTNVPPTTNASLLTEGVLHRPVETTGNVTATNVGVGTVAPEEALHVVGNALVEGSVFSMGDVHAYSDRRLKTKIEKIEGALDIVKQLAGYTFERTDMDTMRRHTGVIAQEVADAFPVAVYENDEGFLSVAYGNLVGLMIEALKELAAAQAVENEQMWRAIENLRSRLI